MTLTTLIIILILLLFIIGTIVSRIKLKSRSFDDKDFFKAKEEAEQILKRQGQFYLQSLLSSYKENQKQLENRKQGIEKEIYQLEDILLKTKSSTDAQIKAETEKMAAVIQQKTKENALQLQSTIDYYNQQQQNVINDFKDFSEDIESKREKLLNEFREAEQKQLEIIEEYKRIEKIKQDKDFYCINLTSAAQEDVRKLKNFAETLRNPIILYKLIYKSYYEKPFTEMLGRVITEQDKCGIYKITNINNGKTYIGQTRQLFKERWRTHLKRGLRADTGSSKLYDAMWDEGVENFTWEVLSTCEPDELNKKEKEYIQFYHADTWGYNSNKGINN